MDINCKGCGIKLQFEHPQELGYSPKKEVQYCQRCFRLTHYDDVMISMKENIEEAEVITKASALKGLIVWVVDCVDFEAGLLKGMQRLFIGRDVLFVLTKCDLLPLTVGDEKLVSFLNSRFKELQLNFVGISLVHQKSREDIELLRENIKKHTTDNTVIFMGKANAGKSTLLNSLLRSTALTVTRYPGTTLDFNKIQVDGVSWYDTPGITNHESMMLAVRDKDLKQILPDSRFKPQIYQLWENQSFAVGGLCRIDCYCKKSTSVVFYISNRLAIHRGKQHTADELWENHQGKMLRPTVTEDFKTFKRLIFDDLNGKEDFCIYGLGWLSVSEGMDKVVIYVPKSVNITQRKAMI